MTRINLIRRRAVASALCVSGGFSGFAATALSVVPNTTLEQRLSWWTSAVVQVDIHGFLFSESPSLNDFRPASEVTNPQRVVLDASITKVLAVRKAVLGGPPTPGLVRIDILLNAEGNTKDALYAPWFGKQSILLLGDRVGDMSRASAQPPVYRQQTGSRMQEHEPMAVERLAEILLLAEKAGLAKVE